MDYNSVEKTCNLMETGLGGLVELLETLWRRTGPNETLCRRMLIYGIYGIGHQILKKKKKIYGNLCRRTY